MVFFKMIKKKEKVGRASPFSAQIIERLPLTKQGSIKTTFHLTLDIEGSGLTFKAGDSLGIFGQNNPFLVDRLLKMLSAHGNECIIDPKTKSPISLRHFLLERANIGRANIGLMHLLKGHNDSLAILLQPHQEEKLKSFLGEHDPLDILHLCQAQEIPLQEFCNQLSPLLPRFYSIASSQKHTPHRVDITVALSSYIHRGEPRFGVASYFLSHLAEENITPIPLYVQPTPHFTLPSNPHTPIIMIGPGTGVAPFRGFMQERIATGALGKNWLFFGECNRATDFFYEDLWLSLKTQNRLHLDVAFSRDQAEKIYVQHLMLEKQALLWSWIEEGAMIYVCGDAEKMAKAVEMSWLTIFQAQGNMSLQDATLFLRRLKKEKRYLTDVY